MKRHLTERELIEYQFKLASDAQMEEIAEHLDGCAQCREHLERLRQRFAALDLLRDEMEVSEDLIWRVVQQTRQPIQPRVVSFRKPAWIGAVAAVLVVGLALLVVHLGEERVPTQPIGGGHREVAKEKAMDKRMEPMKAFSPAEEGAKEITVALAPREKPAAVYNGAAAAPIAARLPMPEQPPFAPASAIELVTLPRRENVQLTIYNSADLTLVRERRNLTLKRGWNWLQFMWANTLIDPTSLSLEPLEQADKIDIQQLVFPARLRELGRWLIRSDVSGQVPFEITYFTSGLAWRAFYMGTLSEDEKTMRLQGYVRVDNKSGEDYEDAQTRLIVGKVHLLDEIAALARRKHAYNRPGVGGLVVDEQDRIRLGVRGRADYSGVVAGYAFNMRDRKEIRKEGLSEYFLYTIEGTETIPDKWAKRLLSFEAEDIAVDSLYKYDEQRWGQQTMRFVSFTNDEEHNLGDTPIPDGTVKIYSQADAQGYLSYVGGAGIKYIPVDEEVELNLGPARLVNVEPVLMDFKTDNYVFDRRNNIAGWDEIRTWKIEVTNTRTLPIQVEITRGFGTAYWMLRFDEPNVSYEKHDATHARFKLNLQPRGKFAFRYTVTTYHGVREEELAKQEGKN